MEYLVLSGFKLVKETGETKAEVENKLLDQGIVPSLIIRNFFKSGKILSNKEASNFFESLTFLFRSTGSMTKSLKFLEDRYDKTKIKFHYNNKLKDFIQ